MKMGKTLKTHITLLAACILLSSCSYTYYLNSGKEDYNNLMYAKAKGKFNKAIQKKPESYESLRMLALTLQKMKDYEGAEKAFELAMNYPQVTLDDKYNYATLLMSRDKHSQAESIFREYITERPGDEVAAAMLESCQFIELFQDDTTLFKIEALPLMGNFSMFSPVTYGQGVVYTAERPVKNGENPWTGNSYNDIYYAKSSGDGFSSQQALAGVFNGKYNDGPIAFNAAQDYAVFTRSNSSNNGNKRKKNDQNFNNLFLYSTQKLNDVWTTANELPFNSEDFSCMHPALSRNGDTLYFSSDMNGGHGLLDLYMTTFNGLEWTEPQNLGTVINTAANDVFPAIGPTGELYFSSDGHPSLGSLDIFKSERIDDVWRKPRNLNYPINSTNDDFSYSYNIADSTGYFSSNREGIDKVYQFRKKPSGKVYIHGTAMTTDRMPLAGVDIVLIDMQTGEIIREFTTDEDGKFDLELQPDKLYKIEGKKEGFFTKTYERSTVDQYEDEDVELIFEMKELIVTDPNSDFGVDAKGIYEVENIYYDYNSDVIRADAATELDKLIQIMFDNPSIHIELHSHTDARGTDEYNKTLSDKRARSAKAYMVINGVDPKRIGTRGYGESRILNKCKNDVECTEEEHQQNRRTEFIVTKA
jgi:outer membrane protein OmpA-like peptidoglycan-associated protein/tetratricopeptide (TPR) repeat protein